MQLHAVKATGERAPQPAVGLHLAEDLFDPLALALTERIVGVADRAAVETRCRATVDHRNVWRDLAASRMSDEVLAMITLVGTQYV